MASKGGETAPSTSLGAARCKVVASLATHAAACASRMLAAAGMGARSTQASNSRNAGHDIPVGLRSTAIIQGSLASVLEHIRHLYGQPPW